MITRQSPAHGRRRATRRPVFRPLVEGLEIRLLPQATLISLSPNSAAEGSPSLAMLVSGSDFTPDAVVQWNGSSLATTFTSDSQLAALKLV